MLSRSRQPLVLLLASDELTRRVTADCLARSDLAVFSTCSAIEADQWLRTQQRASIVDVVVSDTDVHDETDGLSLCLLARKLDRKIGVIYTARFPHRIPPEQRIKDAPCLRTPYPALQLVSVINTLRSSAGNESRRNAA